MRMYKEKSMFIFVNKILCLQTWGMSLFKKLQKGKNLIKKQSDNILKEKIK
jgi:hypothetical protein